jgi:hypothetical protein
VHHKPVFTRGMLLCSRWHTTERQYYYFLSWESFYPPCSALSEILRCRYEHLIFYSGNTSLSGITYMAVRFTVSNLISIKCCGLTWQRPYYNRLGVERIKYVRFEVFTAATMKNVVFWDVAKCRSCVNRRSSETSVHTRSTRHHIPEDGSLQN